MVAKHPKSTKNIFRVTGNFKKGKKNQKFTKEVMGDNKQKAREYIYSIMGSKHRVKRREITIAKIEEIPLDKVNDPNIKQLLGGRSLSWAIYFLVPSNGCCTSFRHILTFFDLSQWRSAISAL